MSFDRQLIEYLNQRVEAQREEILRLEAEVSSLKNEIEQCQQREIALVAQKR
jgi:uncharacterized coiled-coil protein SlyX